MRGNGSTSTGWLYMPLVLSAYDVPAVDVLLISGGVRTDEDLYNLRRAVQAGAQR